MARRRKRSKKWISRLLFLLLLIAAIAVCYFVWDAYFKDSGKKKKEEETVIETTEQVEKEDEEEKKEDIPEVDKKEVVQYEGDNPNEKEDLTGVITYLGVSGNNLVIRVNIDQYLSSGSCVLGINKGTVSLYEDSASVIDSAATSTCEGFNVPLTELGSGKVQIEIKVNADSKTGTIKGETEI